MKNLKKTARRDFASGYLGVLVLKLRLDSNSIIQFVSVEGLGFIGSDFYFRKCAGTIRRCTHFLATPG